MREDDLIKYQGGLIKQVNNAISITNKLLAISERQKIISFFKNNPNFFISLISKYYPLNENLLEKYSSIWEWDLISLNENIQWSEKILEKYSPLFNWDFLSQNGSVRWENGLIEKYESKIEWVWLSANKIFTSSEETIDKYFDNWDWEILSQNPGLPWSVEFIDRFKNEWNWLHLSENDRLPWTLDLIDKFLHNWSWGSLSRLYHLPIELINKYPERVIWNALRWNEKFQWDSETARKNDHIGNKMGLVYTFPLTDDMISVYKTREIGLWECLSLNPNLTWSFELIEKYKDRWVWESLSLNTNLPWSIGLIEKYKEKWDWECLFINKAIPWSFQMLEMFKSKEVCFYSHRYAWYNFKWDFKEINIYDFQAFWDKVFKNSIDDSMIDEIIDEKIHTYGENKYILKKLDEIYCEVEHVLKRLESSFSPPLFSWMFLGIGYDDVFQIMSRVSKFINRYSFWISNDLKTILIDLNLFLNDTCKGINKNKITQMELRAVGASVYSKTEEYRIKLRSQYENDTKPANITGSLKWINQYY